MINNHTTVFCYYFVFLRWGIILEISPSHFLTFLYKLFSVTFLVVLKQQLFGWKQSLTEFLLAKLRVGSLKFTKIIQFLKIGQAMPFVYNVFKVFNKYTRSQKIDINLLSLLLLLYIDFTARICQLRALSPWIKCNMMIRFKPFDPNVPFLYPLKISENRKVFWCFQGVETGCIGTNELTIKFSLHCIKISFY